MDSIEAKKHSLTEKSPSQLSLEEYAKQHGVEAPSIQFYCLPCRHEGRIAAGAVIDNLKKISPDLVLFEEAYGHRGTDFRETLKVIEGRGQMDNDMSADSFNGRVLRHLLDSGIDVRPLNGNFDTEQQAVAFSQKLVESFNFGPTIMKAMDIKDDEEAWNFIETQWGLHVINIIKLQNCREEDILANIAPTIISSPKIKNTHKVAIVFGSDHTKSFLETMRDRGDKVTLVSDDFTKPDMSGDFSLLKEPSFFLWSLVDPFGGEIAMKGRSLYEFEKTLGQKIISIEKVREIFIKLRHGTLSEEDLKI